MPKSNISCQKKLFSNVNEVLFLARRMCYKYFTSTLCIWKTFPRVQVNFWYDLEHHTTRRNNFTTAESNFCWFEGNDSPKVLKSNISRQKKLFSNVNEALFLSRIICCKYFTSTLCIWKTFLRVQANFWYDLEYHTTRRSNLTTGESNFCWF